MSAQDKPVGRSLGWTIQSTSYLYRGQWLDLRQDAFTFRDRSGVYTYVEHPGSVLVVPVTPDEHVLLIRSYRFTIDAWCWEVPAGTLADRGDATPDEIAREELQEEAGATCRMLEPLGTFYLANGFARCRAHVFCALGVERCATLTVQPFEQIGEVAAFSRAEVEGMLDRGELSDADSAFAVLLALRRLRGSVTQ